MSGIDRRNKMGGDGVNAALTCCTARRDEPMPKPNPSQLSHGPQRAVFLLDQGGGMACGKVKSRQGGLDDAEGRGGVDRADGAKDPVNGVGRKRRK